MHAECVHDTLAMRFYISRSTLLFVFDIADAISAPTQTEVKADRKRKDGLRKHYERLNKFGEVRIAIKSRGTSVSQSRAMTQRRLRGRLY